MNKKWSDLNKLMQTQLKREETFSDGLETLFSLRGDLFAKLQDFKNRLGRADFNAAPFLGADGYHSKTIAYSVWHIFRIEDIVAHSLIAGDSQIFFAENYSRTIGSPITTTGNELSGSQITDFSGALDLERLFDYAARVKISTENILRGLPFRALRQRIPEERKTALLSLGVVSTDESAFWLIDYWCNKNIRGLIQMPFSRHWIMHVEASIRIADKLCGVRQLFGG